MELYLIQHGEAKSKQEDPERPLTAKGAENIKKTASFFKQLPKRLDLIWHSGKKRAEQTAEILDETLGTGVPRTGFDCTGRAFTPSFPPGFRAVNRKPGNGDHSLQERRDCLSLR
jgi:broad specificity phosphatase PhoE